MRIITITRQGLVRRLLLPLTAIAFMLGGIAASTSSVEAQAATDDLEKCLQAVDTHVSNCLGDEPSKVQSFVCKWLGGVGYILCIVGEGVKKAADNGPLAA